MNYSEAIRFLEGLSQFGMKPGLENSLRLAALAGNPHERLRFIHVAGTNGKGSTCAMLESIYRAAGLRVGLYTSPHLVSFRERIQVSRQFISESEVVRFTASAADWLKSFPGDFQPTFFELVTCMALTHFANERCDLVIWETGLGGRLDATNIVTPLASVITNIAFDHTQWLGDTLAKITAEKAGILKPGIPVVTAADAPEALAVISEVARDSGSPLTIVTPGDDCHQFVSQVSLPLLGEHQRTNAALAVATVRTLAHQIPVPDESIRRGLEEVRWPGRLQVLQHGEQTILLDGAHNPAGIATLRDALAKHFAGREPVLVIGMLADKDWREIVRLLAPIANRILVVPVASHRSLAPQDLAAEFQRQNSRAGVVVGASIKDALKQLASDSFIVITGSLYLIGEAMELLGATTEGVEDEKKLNEWSRFDGAAGKIQR